MTEMSQAQRDELLRQLLDRLTELEFAVDKLFADQRIIHKSVVVLLEGYRKRRADQAKHGNAEVQN